jgi:hypothetical protein
VLPEPAGVADHVGRHVEEVPDPAPDLGVDIEVAPCSNAERRSARWARHRGG